MKSRKARKCFPAFGRLLPFSAQQQGRLRFGRFAARRLPSGKKGGPDEGEKALHKFIVFPPVEESGEGRFKIIGLHAITSVG